MLDAEMNTMTIKSIQCQFFTIWKPQIFGFVLLGDWEWVTRPGAQIVCGFPF
jgi:hypothetical protein